MPSKLVLKTEKTEKKYKQFSRPFILGSMDGLITSFVIIIGGIAGNIKKKYVITIGISSLIADAFSMGVSEYLSSRTENTINISLLYGSLCFMGFLLFGSIPIIGFVLSNDIETVITIIIFLCSLLIIGFLRSYVVSSNYIKTMSEVFILGIVTGGISYGVAYLQTIEQKPSNITS